MTVRCNRWPAVWLAGLMLCAPARAEEPPPPTGEKCIEQCDIKSDECMADAEGDLDKQQACDDHYGECLDACK